MRVKIKDLRKKLPKSITQTIEDFLESLPEDEVVTSEDISKKVGIPEPNVRWRVNDALFRNKKYDKVKIRTAGVLKNVYGKRVAIDKVREMIKSG